MMRMSAIAAVALLSVSNLAKADERPRYFISSTPFMLANLLPKPPHFAQLNFGARLTARDTLIVEAITWRYPAPLGIPYWNPLFENSNAEFPGFARDIGVGLAYQRFWWKGLYTTVHATPFVQTYHRRSGALIQTGFQLFVVARVGWHFDLFDQRLFIEPSMAATSWPINTNLPPGFQAEEDKWPKVFFPEPGLHIGVQF